MIFGLKSLELVYLLVALTIVGQQLVVRQGIFDPTALAAIAFFVGLIPAGRADKRSNGDSVSPIQRALKRFLKIDPPEDAE